MATTLTRWDPFNELTNVRSVMDRLFDQRFGRFPGARAASEELGPASLGIDVYETTTEYVVKAAVPGIAPEELDISVEDEVLTIRGEFRQETEVSEDTYLRKELRTGAFQRALRLPPTVDAENASAAFEHGVLKLTLPKKPEAQARSIKIKVA